MAGKGISRNDPCPCGSGRKFKNCCIAKDIDWAARRAAAPRPPLTLSTPGPRSVPPRGLAVPGLFGVVDAKLKEVANASQGPAALKEQVGSLSETTPCEERMSAYRAIREAGVLPADAAGFLFAHAAQWMPPAEDAAGEENEADDALDRHTLAMLRRFGADDLADLYVTNRLEYDRRHERGRQFFFGPPDEQHAERLREMRIIE